VPDLMSFDASPGNVSYTFGGREPVGEIHPGDLVRLRTLDCFGGNVRSVADLPSKMCEFPFLNPVTGPLYVSGADIGDTLAVHITDLTVASNVGYSATFPHFGALTRTATTAMLHPALAEVVWQYTIDAERGTIRYAARNSNFEVDLPLSPMLGTVGVAPAGGETRLSIVPGWHGGNLDCPQLTAGATLYLPVSCEGALLAVGDGHARQGDGELCGVAVEVPMDVTLTVDVLPGLGIAGPWLETDEQIMCIGVARPLEDAYRSAHHGLVRLVQDLTALDELDAYQLVSQAGTARIGNVVDEQYTIAAAIDKGVLDRGHAFQNAHQRLRAVGGNR
jgi:amidase